MTAKRLEGLRTLIGFTIAIVALVVGLAFLQADQRAGAYTAFSVAVVGVFLGLAGKGATGVLANGTGAAGAWRTLTTDAKPGDPPSPPAAP